MQATLNDVKLITAFFIGEISKAKSLQYTRCCCQIHYNYSLRFMFGETIGNNLGGLREETLLMDGTECENGI